MVNGLRWRWRSTPLGDKAATCTANDFQRVGHNICEGLRLRARQGDVDQRRDHSHQRPMQNETGLDPSTHPERSQKAHDKGSGRSSVMQEIVAETQAERNNRQNESHFGEQAAEQNSYPVDS